MRRGTRRWDETRDESLARAIIAAERFASITGGADLFGVLGAHRDGAGDVVSGAPLRSSR